MTCYFSKILQTVIRKMSTRTEIELTPGGKATDVICNSIPKLSIDLYKGMMGRIGIIGGSREYTGAPFYSAMTALRLGADLAHIFCCKDAGTSIKSYSPDLIVHPILNDLNVIEQLKEWLPRFHAVVVGPGLGRDNEIIKLTEKIFELLKEDDKITIIDADGLYVITQNISILKGFKNVILTPNIVEHKRLVDSLEEIQSSENKIPKDINDYFPTVTLVCKGRLDIITNSTHSMKIGGKSLRRCGGQGDILSGAIALFAYWYRNVQNGKFSKEIEDDLHYRMILACATACGFTRYLNKITFEELGRGMLASDMVDPQRMHRANQLLMMDIAGAYESDVST